MRPILEVNKNCIDKTVKDVVVNDNGEEIGLMICPPVGEDYWVFRVKLCKDQAVLGFPKFGMIGVGMALEEDGNTNLPLCTLDTPFSNAIKIANHIKCNKKYKSITFKMIVDAILLIEEGAKQYCENGERAYHVQSGSF